MSDDRAGHPLPAPEPAKPPEPPARPSPSLQIDEHGFAWITFNDPARKLNVLDQPSMETLSGVLDEVRRLANSGQVRAVIVTSGKHGSFIAGADVDAIQEIESPDEGEAASRTGQEIFLHLERLPIPTVAAIDGICIGGGAEIALACRFRLASDSPKTRIGFPEVQLGILPAWGGTTRLPRLVGLQAALDLLLTGKTVSASGARRIGLVSEVVPAAQFHEQVVSFAERTISLPAGASRKKRKVLARIMDDTPPGRRLVLAAARRRVLARTGGHYPAPLRILDVLRRGLASSVRRSLELEAAAAGELIASETSKNLLHVFQLREHARKRPEAAHGAEARKVERIAVLGAGVMGGGIAQLGAYNGLPVRMKDIRHEAVASGLQHAQALFQESVRKRRMKPREAARGMELITGGIEYHGFGNVDLVIEAVVERMDVKKAVLGEAEEQIREDCILATNTSSLSVDEMASALQRPGNFCGMHFFNPVHKMPLVEVVRGAETSDVTVATIHALAIRLGKVPVVVGDGPGFLVNRILGPYLNEATWLLLDGASIEDIDEAARRFGMPMGPLRLLDEVGIDIARHAGDTLHQAFGERMAPAPPLVSLGASQRKGRKNGLGFYHYDDERGGGEDVDDSVYADLDLTRPEEGGGPPEREIRTRLVLAMINEAARVLGDRIVRHPGDVDVGMVMGTGFPPFRGGLLLYADSVHPRALVERLESLAASQGPRFQPAPLLEELASRDRTFYGAFGS